MKIRFTVFLVTMVIAVFLVAASCQNAEPLNSGIRGTATLGPLSPVETMGETNEAPYAGAVIIVKNASGSKEIARTKTAEDGTFTVVLSEGSYSVEGVNPEGTMLPYAAPFEVQVEKDKYTDIMVSFDTGIR